MKSDNNQADKYFTPSIEDIRVGYECEWTSDGLVFNTPYSEPLFKGKLEYSDVLDILKWCAMDDYSLAKIVRTPYLTKEQIEAEGWVLSSKKGYQNVFSKNGYELHYTFDNSNLFIDNGHQYDQQDIYYNGECKDINTFRYICKLLDIK